MARIKACEVKAEEKSWGGGRGCGEMEGDRKRKWEHTRGMVKEDREGASKGVRKRQRLK